MRTTVTALLLGVLALTGCTAADDLRSRADALLQQGQQLASTFSWCTSAAQLAQAVVAGDVEAARREASTLQADAPEELAADLRVIADAAARAESGESQQLLDDEVQQAAGNVYAFAVDRCGLPGAGPEA